MKNPAHPIYSEELFKEGLKGSYKHSFAAIVKAKKELDSLEYKIVWEALGGKYSSLYHKIGVWDCVDSPIGVCMYDDIDDPAWDNCLYCDEPDERK